jgi:hypothetical protein
VYSGARELPSPISLNTVGDLHGDLDLADERAALLFFVILMIIQKKKKKKQEATQVFLW